MFKEDSKSLSAFIVRITCSHIEMMLITVVPA